MLNHIDSYSMGALLLIVIFLVIIRHQVKKMGKIKSKIIDANIILIISLNTIIILNIVKDYEILRVIHILIFSSLIVLSDFAFVFFYNNIRENGVVFDYKNILW